MNKRIYLTILSLFMSYGSLSLAQGDRCYFYQKSSTGKMTLAIGQTYGGSSDRLGLDVNSVKELYTFLDTLEDLQAKGICPTDPNPGTCYVDQGAFFTGISIKDTPDENRNVIYALINTTWSDFRAALDALKAVGVCSAVEY